MVWLATRHSRAGRTAARAVAVETALMTSRDRFKVALRPLPRIATPALQPLPPIDRLPRPMVDPPYAGAGR